MQSVSFVLLLIMSGFAMTHLREKIRVTLKSVHEFSVFASPSICSKRYWFYNIGLVGSFAFCSPSLWLVSSTALWCFVTLLPQAYDDASLVMVVVQILMHLIAVSWGRGQWLSDIMTTLWWCCYSCFDCWSWFSWNHSLRLRLSLIMFVWQIFWCPFLCPLFCCWCASYS